MTSSITVITKSYLKKIISSKFYTITDNKIYNTHFIKAPSHDQLIIWSSMIFWKWEWLGDKYECLTRRRNNMFQSHLWFIYGILLIRLEISLYINVTVKCLFIVSVRFDDAEIFTLTPLPCFQLLQIQQHDSFKN